MHACDLGGMFETVVRACSLTLRERMASFSRWVRDVLLEQTIATHGYEWANEGVLAERQEHKRTREQFKAVVKAAHAAELASEEQLARVLAELKASKEHGEEQLARVLAELKASREREKLAWQVIEDMQEQHKSIVAELDASLKRETLARERGRQVMAVLEEQQVRLISELEANHEHERLTWERRSFANGYEAAIRGDTYEGYVAAKRALMAHGTQGVAATSSGSDAKVTYESSAPVSELLLTHWRIER